MRFFSVFAPLALAIVAFASPLANPEPVPDTNDLAVRNSCNSCRPLPAIIVDVTVQVTPHVNYLKSLSAKDCTAEKVKPSIIEIKGIIEGAIVEVKALAGVSLDIVLSTSGGILGLVDLCNLIVTLYTLIFGCFSAVLSVVVSVEYGAVVGLLVEVGVLLGSLLNLILSIVGGLFILVKTLLVVILPTVNQIGCKESFSYLY
ncbi:hypothetical protein VKT23_008065 [Stygiomarasmius scandens]|uniref:Transmembrane protein n=1 Tax=Marasmiellus scandens TaxID=2682957 RepID=A0ABR1JJ70_9AGAR